MAQRQQLYRLFGDLLDYPDSRLSQLAHAALPLLEAIQPQALARMANFAIMVDVLGIEQMEEIYTATFEINPASYIYAGYVLFGESSKRGALLVKLQAEYRQRGFTAHGELADHLPTMLRFVATVADDDAMIADLIDECIAPAVHQMRETMDPANPYASLLSAVLAVIDPAGRSTLAAVLQRFGGGFLPLRVEYTGPAPAEHSLAAD